MELLKKIFVTLIVFLVANSYAQDYKAMEDAFQKSIGYENKQDYTNAISSIKPFATSTNYEVNVRLGWLYYSAGDFNNSVTYYSKAISLRPNATEPLWGIVYPYGELKKWTELQDIYNKIIVLDPKNTTANYRLGLSAYYNKDYTTAKKYFDIVITLYPLDYNTLLMSAWTYYFLGKMNDAKLTFNKVLMIMPDDKSAKEGLALIK